MAKITFILRIIHLLGGNISNKLRNELEKMDTIALKELWKLLQLKQG